MYRSTMAATRQAVSMDCESTSYPVKYCQHGSSTFLNVPSPLQRKRFQKNQDSLELELGASASEVHAIHSKEREISSGKLIFSAKFIFLK